MSQTGKNSIAASPASESPTQARRYFLGLFTVESWREFKRNGGHLMGFNEKKSKAAARMQPGDRILCYLSKVSAFVGIMEVTGPSYLDHTPIWSDGVFPVRLPVRVVTEVPLSGAVPIRSLRGKLSFMPGSVANTGWTVYVRSSPRLWNPQDAEAVCDALTSNLSTGLGNTTGAAAASPPQAKVRRRLRLPLSARVGRIISKTDRLSASEEAGLLGSYESALSYK